MVKIFNYWNDKTTRARKRISEIYKCYFARYVKATDNGKLQINLLCVCCLFGMWFGIEFLPFRSIPFAWLGYPCMAQILCLFFIPWCHSSPAFWQYIQLICNTSKNIILFLLLFALSAIWNCIFFWHFWFETHAFHQRNACQHFT